MNDVPPRYVGLIRWAFGNTPALAEELLALVLAGKKTATCSALWKYETEHWPMPQKGEMSIVVDSAKRPRCIVETTGVEIKRFEDVDAEFAHDEGEGDQSYEHWRAVHEKYFRGEGRFSPDMMIVCERFRVVEKLPVPVKESAS
jgi:uncharacterized protein YhfF